MNLLSPIYCYFVFYSVIFQIWPNTGEFLSDSEVNDPSMPMGGGFDFTFEDAGKLLRFVQYLLSITGANLFLKIRNRKNRMWPCLLLKLSETKPL